MKRKATPLKQNKEEKGRNETRIKGTQEDLDWELEDLVQPNSSKEQRNRQNLHSNQRASREKKNKRRKNNERSRSKGRNNKGKRNKERRGGGETCLIGTKSEPQKRNHLPWWS